MAVTQIPCAADPPRWANATTPDAEAQNLCRTACPIRRECLSQAVLARPEGIWGGFLLPDHLKEARQWRNQMNGVKHALAVMSGGDLNC